jgi:glycosyltransferase involved in cell wall biosynthesis
MISIVICTRDRAARLERCLHHLSDACRCPDLAWQLVVVDNASIDSTKQVVEGFRTRLPLKYAFEARHGLSHARNRGIAEAEHSIIAFTDDDCLVSQDWARAIVTEFAERPGLSVLGGSVELADSNDYPVSIRTHRRTEHVTTAQQIMSMMSGCNMAFRRDVFEHVGLFDPAFGKGQRIGAAEDTDFLYRALRVGSRIVYAPHVVVRHAHGRDTPEAVASVTRDYVRGRGAFYCKFIADRQIARMAYWEVSGLLRQSLRVSGGSGSARLLRGLATGALYKSLHGLRSGAARAAAWITP